ncbi:hypothetical protein RND71_003381 [Anisodus tanguticus]|uniref:Uncharacterized protein n=1 Tax=Anisodus tanguticus TaxID=243964 RepID=A0AAE1SVS2_9SOLA|nr:hypothetical protein RND71_003381 [Anisodus tanguticus]
MNLHAPCYDNLLGFTPSYAEIAHDEQDDNEGYEKLNKRDVILILDNKDLERKDEPWKLMERYLEAGTLISSSDESLACSVSSSESSGSELSNNLNNDRYHGGLSEDTRNGESPLEPGLRHLILIDVLGFDINYLQSFALCLIRDSQSENKLTFDLLAASTQGNLIPTRGYPLHQVQNMYETRDDLKLVVV